MRQAKPKQTALQETERRCLIAALLLTDSIAIGTSFSIAYIIRFKSGFSFFHAHSTPPLRFYSILVFLLIPVWLLIFAAFRLYDFHYLLGGTQEYASVVNASTMGTMVVIVATFLDPNLIIARGWLLISWVISIIVVGIERFTLRRVVYHLRRRGFFSVPTIIIGANEEGKAIALQFKAAPTSGIRIVGFVDDNLPEGSEVVEGVKVLSSTTSLEELVRKHSVKELVIASTAISRERLLDIFYTFNNSNEVEIRLSSGLFEILTTGMRVKEIACVPLVSLNRVRLTGIQVLLKGLLDYSLALAGLLFLSPLFLIIALLVKLDSPGPIFYKRKVLGMGGKTFNALKFRTMVANADEILEQSPDLKRAFEDNFKLKEDPRVTRLGRFLRKHSLDELPQLINVLKGEMSIVGPRMITPEEAEKYGKWKMNLLTVKPGMSGLWVVSGRSDIPYEERVRLDMYYIRNYSVWLDLHILFRTIPMLLKGKGAY